MDKFEAITPFGKDILILDGGENDPFLGYVEGLAATNDIDRYRDIISDNALAKGASDLLKHTTVFENHEYNTKNAVGKIVNSQFVSDGENKSGILVKVGISKTALEMWTKIKEGILNKFSIGGIFLDTDYDEDKDVRFVNDMELWELSFVGVPANPHCSFSSLAMKHIQDVETKIKLKREKPNMDDEKFKKLEDQVSSLAKLIEAQSKEKPDPEPDAQKTIADPRVDKLVESVEVLAKGVASYVTEKQEKLELAERKSQMVDEQRAAIEKMSFKEKEDLEWQAIKRTLADPTVREVVLVGDGEPSVPIFQMDAQEAIAEKRELGVFYR